jgi:hypothetical protein
MIYVQLSDKYDANGFLVLAKSGTPVYCLAGNIYGVRSDHLKILRRKRIPFKKLNARDVHLPKSPLAA